MSDWHEIWERVIRADQGSEDRDFILQAVKSHNLLLHMVVYAERICLEQKRCIAELERKWKLIDHEACENRKNSRKRIVKLEAVAKKIAGNHCTCGSEKNQCAYCQVYKVIHGRPVHADKGTISGGGE